MPRIIITPLVVFFFVRLELLMKLNSLVAQIITAPNFDRFSILEVRSAYLALSDDKTTNPSEIRRYIYAELVKLVNNGWLIKSVSVGKKITSYTKTEKFDPTAINVHSKVEIEDEKDKCFVACSRMRDTLTQRLNHYKNELLTGLGEVEEYKRLCNQFPELHSKLQPKYNEVREQNSKLLGNIKAVESLISNK